MHFRSKQGASTEKAAQFNTAIKSQDGDLFKVPSGAGVGSRAGSLLKAKISQGFHQAERTGRELQANGITYISKSLLAGKPKEYLEKGQMYLWVFQSLSNVESKKGF